MSHLKLATSLDPFTFRSKSVGLRCRVLKIEINVIRANKTSLGDISMEYIFGIDVSKTTSNIAISVDNNIVKEFKIDNNEAGFEFLFKEIQQAYKPLIIFEATGIYSRRLENFLQQKNQPYSMVNPLRAKKDMDSFRHNKTDSLDAIALAQAMAMHHYDKTIVGKPVYSDLRDLERGYQEMNEDIVREKNRLHKALSATFPELETLLGSTDSDLYWNIVRLFPSPDLVLKHSASEIFEIILNGTYKKIGKYEAHRISGRLIYLANKSHKADHIKYAIKDVRRHVSNVQKSHKEKAEQIEDMAKLAKDLPEVKNLVSIPGIAIKTAVCLIAELGDIRRFYSSNAINAFVGIDLIHYQSGNYTASEHIRKCGNAYARKILFKAVLNVIAVSKRTKIPNNISLFYDRKKQSSGPGGTKKIVIAAMHHLIRTIYHLVLNNEIYDTEMFSGEH